MPNLMVAKCLISNASGTRKVQLPAQILALPAWGRETDVAGMDSTNVKASRRTVLHPSVRTLRPVFLTKGDARG